MVDYISHVHDRIEHWAIEALRSAFDDVHRHRRSEPIAGSMRQTFIQWKGNPDAQAPMESTDIDLTPERSLTYGMFADCLRVMSWFVATYPEWDFGFAIELSGVAGKLGVMYLYYAPVKMLETHRLLSCEVNGAAFRSRSDSCC